MYLASTERAPGPPRAVEATRADYDEEGAGERPIAGPLPKASAGPVGPAHRPYFTVNLLDPILD